MKKLLLSTLFLLFSVAGISVEAKAARAHAQGTTRMPHSTSICSAGSLGDGYADNLSVAITDANNALAQCTPGDNPGFYSQEKAEALQTEIAKAQSVLEKANETECQQEIPVLVAATKALTDSRKQVTDGYYYIVSANSVFAEKQPDVKMAMYAENGGLNWGILDQTSAKYAFKITKLEDGNYSIQNVLSGTYIRFGEDIVRDFTDATDTQIKFSDTLEVAQRIVNLNAAGQFNIFNVRNSRAYNTQSAGGGSAQNGTVCSWTSEANGEAAWSFTPITDESLIQSYKEQAENEVAPAKIAAAITLFDNSATGTAPGCYAQDKVDQLSTAISAAEQAVESGNKATIGTAIAALDKAVAAVKASQVPLTDGYYWIWSRNSQLVDQLPDGKFAMNAQGNALFWGVLDKEDGKFAFKVTKRDDGYYDIQNVLTDQYIEYAEDVTGAFSNGNNVQIRLTATPSVAQRIVNLPAAGQFNIFNTRNTRAYNTQISAGESQKGVVCSWTTTSNGESAWSFEPIADESLIQKYQNDAKLAIATEVMNQMLTAAKQARVKTIDNKPLVTDASQFSANSSSASDYSSFEHLIDGNTHYKNNFHSRWEASSMQNALIDEATWAAKQEEFAAANPENRAVGVGYHNLQVKLNEPIQVFFFRYIGRTGTSVVDNPTDIEIYATNSDELGASTDQADIAQWKKITELTEGFPGKVAGAVYNSPNITMDQTYKYIRFVVKKTAMMNTVPYRMFNNPGVTGVTWNVGEFQLYDPKGASTSEYLTVPGMKEAVDALDALVEENQKKIEEKTITLDDTAAIAAAIRKVESLYIDRDALDAVMAQVLDSANNVYEIVTGAKTPLITDPMTQCLSNSSSTNDHSSFVHLIDGIIDPAHNFHSRWDAKMAEQNIDAATWASDMADYAEITKHNCGVGYGYHNLQIKLFAPVKKFWLEMTSRSNTTYTDTPNDIELYVTNDDEAGASADNANQNLWTLAGHLNENMPQDGGGIFYKSPVIELDQAYKYIRMVVKNTSHRSARNFGTPDVTGITWNVGDLQFYSELDAERAPYNYNGEMKSACDALKTLADAAAALPQHSMLNDDKIKELRAALEKVNSLIVDTTEFSALYKKMSTIANHTTAGETIGYTDTQESIDNFKKAIAAAHSSVNFNQPQKSTIQPAIDALNKAYDELMTHVNNFETGKWYYIISKAPEGEMSTETVLPAREIRDAALYITGSGANYGATDGTFSSGLQLRWGMDDVRGADQATDASAIWRFVPAPDSLGKNVYYLQNMRSGMYVGNSNAGTDCFYSNDVTPYPFLIDFIGGGQFNIIAVGKTNHPGPICAGNNARQIRADIPETGIDERTSWAIEPISDAMDAISTSYPGNSIQIVSMPFAVSDLSNYNEGVKTYAILGRVSDNKIGLVEKTSFEAGEPFIMTVGDYKAYVENGTKVPVLFSRPADVSLDEKTANGLVAVLDSKKITLAGAGYLQSAVLKVVEDITQGVTIPAESGYIDVSGITNGEGTPSLILSTEGPLAVKSITTNTDNKTVNVYSIDGKLIKKSVKASEAAKGLEKGIYIIGNKKIAVK